MWSRDISNAARALWVLVFLAIIAMFLAGIPVADTQFHHICRSAQCPTGELSVAGFRDLRSMGLSIDVYVGYIIGLNLLSAALWLGLGFLLFLRSRGDRMALVAAYFLTVLAGGTGAGIVDALGHAEPAWRLAVAVSQYLGPVSAVVFFVLFPYGRPVPRWSALFILPPAIFIFPAPGGPADLPTPWSYVAQSFAGILLATSVLGIAGNQVWRYRRISTEQQRRQTRLILLGSGLTVFTIAVVVITLTALVSQREQQNPLIVLGSFSLWTVTQGLIPVTIALAVVRYRLWDIDTLINRTLVYGSLTLSLAALYIAGVVGLQALARAVTGQSSDITVAVATLAVAALFNPWRRGLQGFIDRRFYRRKYDAAHILAAFGARLRDEVDLDQLTGDLATVVGETVQPTSLSLWLRQERQNA